jgi:hypothetical protein
MPDRPPSPTGPLTSRPGRLALVARDLADLRFRELARLRAAI